MRLKLFTCISSEHGLSSVTTLIVGSRTAALIDPPLLLQDVHTVISFVRSKTPNPVTAIFVSSHHPDHYFAADIILEAYPLAKFFAAPYVVGAIDRDYEDQVIFWSKMVGPSSLKSRPSKPKPYQSSFFVLPDDLTSPIVLLGPVRGCTHDQTIFWLPTERTIVAGDVVFSRSTHLSMENIDTSSLLAAWRASLDLIYSLDPLTIVAGHLEKGTQFDARKDMEHMYRYLDLFEDKVIRPYETNQLKASKQELFAIFRDSFPLCQKNLDYSLGRMTDKFGDGAQNLRQDNGGPATSKSKHDLPEYIMAAGSVQ